MAPMGEHGGGGGTILREIFVAMGLDVDEASFAKGVAAGELVAKAAEKLSEMAGEAIREFVGLIEKTTMSAKELTEMSQSTGLSATALQQLRFAAEESGVGVEQLDVGIFHLARTMAGAAKGGGAQAAVFEHLHVKVKGANGQLRDVDETLAEVADQFKGMQDGAQKTALAMEIFGRSGARLIPLLNLGADGMAELRGEAFTLSEEQVKAGRELAMTQIRLKTLTENLWKSAVAPLLTTLNDLLKRYLAWRKANADITKQRITAVFQKVANVLGLIPNLIQAISNALPVLGVVIASIGVAFAILEAEAVTAALASAAAWALAALPFVLIGAVIAGLIIAVDDLVTYMEGGDSLIGRYIDRFKQWIKIDLNDSPILNSFKYFLKLMTDAVEIIEHFYNLNDPKKNDAKAGKSKAEIQRDADKQTIQSAGYRAALGQNLTPAEIEALRRQRGSEVGFADEYRIKGAVPSAAQQTMPGQVMNPSPYQPTLPMAYHPPESAKPQFESIGGGNFRQTNHIVVNAAAGMSEGEIAARLVDEMQKHTDKMHEEANASLGGGP